MPDLIRDFGAVPGTDCTAALLAAAQWLSTRPGSELVLRRGVYKLTQALIFSAPVSIVGWGGGFGDYSTLIQCEGNGRMEIGAGAGGSFLAGFSVGGWNVRNPGAALTVRVPARLSCVSVIGAEVGLKLDGRTGNVNWAHVSGLTAADCDVGFHADGNDANAFGVIDGNAQNCDVGWRTTAVLGSPTFINCRAECPTGRGWDIQTGGGSVKLIGCYDESAPLLPGIVDDPSFLVGCGFYHQHIASGAPRVPATEIAAIGDQKHVRALQGLPSEPRVWATIGDPQSQGQVAFDAFLDGDGTTTQRFQIRCPYAGPSHADYWEGYVPGVSALRVKRSDAGSYLRGTVQVPKLLVGGNATTATTFGLGAVDVAAKLAELEARIAQLEAP